MLIAADHLALLSLFLIADIEECGVELYILVLGFLPLDAHHFLNGVFDVEHKVILPEFVSFDLCEIKEVLDDEIHKLCRVLLNLLALCKVIQDLQTVLEILSFL